MTKRPGQLVITKTGKKGRTFNDDPLVNGKRKVYLQDSQKPMDFNAVGMLCDITTLKVIGYID